MSTHNVCGCTSEDCRVNGCLMKRQRNEAGGFYAADSADCGCSTGTGARMTNKNTDGPAFPVWELNGSGVAEMTDFGMSLRDYFAAKAMQGICASGPGVEWSDLRIAQDAYNLADAMLKAREQT